jgi:aspartate/methionine/tyrosine aminotransferase
MSFQPFAMERWQSTYEHDVSFNLSESGVEPLTLAELMRLADVDADEVLGTLLEYNPSKGSARLRQRIAAMYPGAGADNILVTNGGAEANFVISWKFCTPGAEVVYVAPNYMQVPGMAANWGCVARPWNLQEGADWEPDADELDDLVGEDTSLIVVTNPNNPTGAVLSEDMMGRIVAAAERVGAWILADEIYRGAELDGVESPSFWGRYDRLLITSGLSKAYGLPGLRLGWAVVPAELVEELWARKDYTSISMGALSDKLAAEALRPEVRDKLRARTRAILNDNLPVLEAWMGERAPIFTWRRPRAGAIVYARYDLPVDGFTLAERLRVEADCLIVPGEHFNMPGFVRLGFGPETSRLRDALERCATVIDPLHGAA